MSFFGKNSFDEVNFKAGCQRILFAVMTGFYRQMVYENVIINPYFLGRFCNE